MDPLSSSQRSKPWISATYNNPRDDFFYVIKELDELINDPPQVFEQIFEAMFNDCQISRFEKKGDHYHITFESDYLITHPNQKKSGIEKELIIKINFENFEIIFVNAQNLVDTNEKIDPQKDLNSIWAYCQFPEVGMCTAVVSSVKWDPKQEKSIGTNLTDVPNDPEIRNKISEELSPYYTFNEKGLLISKKSIEAIREDAKLRTVEKHLH